MSRRSFGIAGAMPADRVRRLAPLLEQAGYHALWVNDTPEGDALVALAAAAGVTTTLGLATGVIPLDRRSGAEIAARVRDLPAVRLRIGVGSGRSRHPLAVVESGVAELRAGCDVPIVVGALGPRSRALAARIADGILFSWLSPDAAAQTMAQLRADADGRAVDGILYARTIAAPGARAQLEEEAARYGAVPSYAANFARLGITPMSATLDLTEPAAVDAYSAVDELVLRAVTASDDFEELVRLLEAGAPTPG